MSMRYISLLLMVFALAVPNAAQAQRVNQSLGTMPVQAEAPAPIPQTDQSPQTEERIAAVVNDGIISTADVRARTKLAMLTAGLPDNDEIKKRLLPQVLHGLIDEQLQLQEGKRLEINVTQEEIQQALGRLAQGNNVPNGDMAAFLAARGVPISTLVSQIRSAITWNKVAQRVLRPRIDIGDDEIDAVVERMRANAGKQEYLVSEIYLAVDDPKDEERVKEFADGLVQQIKGGASFGAVARQFSQGTGAPTGGDIGWIQVGQLAPELDKVLQDIQAGEVAGPIRTSAGYHILGVREKRTIAMGDVKEMSVSLQQAFRPFTASSDKEALLKEAERLRQSVSECKGLPEKINSDFAGWRWQDLGEVKLSEAPTWLANKVRDIAIGHASDAMATDKGALIMFVCNRKMPESINRNEIMNTIGTERIELLARRQLRDLRRNAYLDIRLASMP